MFGSDQQGVALLMALLVVTVASAFAVSLVHEQTIGIRQLAGIQQTELAMVHNRGLEDFARLLLQQDANDSNIDTLDELWATPTGVGFEEKGIVYFGRIDDAQAKINLNGIENPITQDRLRALCQQLDVSPLFIPALVDWVDSNIDLVNGDGAEDDYYTSLDVPYRPANQKMTDISELLIVKGMNYEIYQELLPFITVLPEDTSLNLNTIPREVYLSLDNNLDADLFIQQREDSAFENLQDYQSRMNHTLPKDGIAFSSKFFVASGNVTIGDKIQSFSTLLQRDNNGATTIIYRRLGDF